MHCPSCEMLIEMAVADLEGVEEVKADYSKDKVAVTYDPEKVKETKIISAVNDAGYEVKEVVIAES